MSAEATLTHQRRSPRSTPAEKQFWKMVEKRTHMNELERVKSIRSGLSSDAAHVAKDTFQLTARAISELLGLSVATYERRRKDDRPLDPSASERLDRIIEVAKLTEEVFENRAEATRWLSTPNEALGGATPLLHCDTEIGARQVRRILHALEWGGVV